jgi:aconitate hydratase
MGVLPLTFKDGESYESLGLDGTEVFQIDGIENIQPRQIIKVVALNSDGVLIQFEVITRLNSALEVAYFKNGGILPFVLRKILSN